MTDLELLARIIRCEAGGEGENGMKGVACVVMNRVHISYGEYSRLGGTMVFTDLLKEAGLGDPFNEETLKKVCAAADQYLADYDLSGIE